MSPGPSSRATRGANNYRQQPTKRFHLNVPAQVGDGNALDRGERVGTEQQGYLGPVILGRIPYLTTTSRADFLSAFNKRANYHTNDRVEPFVRFSSIKLINKLVPKPMPKIVWDTELYRDWLGMFDSEKQKRMEKAYEFSGLNKLQDYSNKQIFTKVEALVKDPDVVAPRLIFQGSDYYNMVSGPMMKALMDRFIKLGDTPDTFKFRIAYRQETNDITDFLCSKKCSSFIEADFSANDKSQVGDVVNLEVMFMRRLGAPAWFLRLHRAANKFSVYNTKYGISAIIENQLPSGATDGTFRNTFWNMCIFYTWTRKVKIDGCLAVFLGDDMLAGYDRRVRRASRQYRQVATMARMDAKVTTAPSLERCHFLSKHFVPVTRQDVSYVMLPMVGKMLAKFNSRPNSNQSVSDDEYMAGKALSHCYLYRNCHVLRDKFVARANVHLARTDGKYSLEGVTYHVRVHAAYKGEVEALLSGSTEHEDLVTVDDLSNFWFGLADLGYSDILPVLDAVILDCNYSVCDILAGRCLVDY